MFKRIKEVLAPITVRVFWEGEYIIHKSWSREDALGWMSAYPRNASAVVFNRFGTAAGIRRSS